MFVAAFCTIVDLSEVQDDSEKVARNTVRVYNSKTFIKAMGEAKEFVEASLVAVRKDMGQDVATLGIEDVKALYNWSIGGSSENNRMTGGLMNALCVFTRARCKEAELCLISTCVVPALCDSTNKAEGFKYHWDRNGPFRKSLGFSKLSPPKKILIPVCLTESEHWILFIVTPSNKCLSMYSSTPIGEKSWMKQAYHVGAWIDVEGMYKDGCLKTVKKTWTFEVFDGVKQLDVISCGFLVVAQIWALLRNCELKHEINNNKATAKEVASCLFKWMFELGYIKLTWVNRLMQFR